VTIRDVVEQHIRSWEDSNSTDIRDVEGPLATTIVEFVAVWLEHDVFVDLDTVRKWREEMT